MYMKKFKPVFDDSSNSFGALLKSNIGCKMKVGSEYATQDYGDYLLFGLKKKVVKK